jgi:hypothetical protein
VSRLLSWGVRRLETRVGMGKNAQEGYARTLHGELSRELASKLPGTTASISGAGVHWNCHAERELLNTG